MITVNN